jgi:hypothetical protein
LRSPAPARIATVTPVRPRFAPRLVGLLLLGLTLLALTLLAPLRPASAQDPTSASQPPVWRELDAAGEPRVHLYFYWSLTCSHCKVQRPIVDELAARSPWLVVHAIELSRDPEAAQRYAELATSLGQQARYIPALAACGQLHQGLLAADELEALVLTCRDADPSTDAELATPAPETELEVPLLGRVDLRRWSLPLTTVVLASLDAFNPCAFFVLLFLLSLLVRTQSRGRMLLISGIFIGFSGLWYFVFMAAWLNMFLWFGELRWMTLAAGAVAVIMAGINIKDFFVPDRGPSLSIPEAAKPGLFARMRKLARASSLPSAIFATVLLAGVANSYELLCTAGLPMIYTRVLTLAELSVAQYYLYLALYNLIYVVPLIVIVGVSIKTLGKRKLQAHEGRALKLLSGLMMLGLGLALLLAPALLAELGVAIGLLAGAVVLTAIIMAIDKRLRGDQGPGTGGAQAGGKGADTA